MNNDNIIKFQINTGRKAIKLPRNVDNRPDSPELWAAKEAIEKLNDADTEVLLHYLLAIVDAKPDAS
jgi:hypothetical protein